MKRKYGNLLRKAMLFFLSFLLSIGSFLGLFAVQAAAYDVTSTGQLKLQSGVCYNGKDPNHPFVYTTERMGINANTYLPPYKRGNDGAGGNLGGTTEMLMKRINTGSAWSSVPLYRVSRSGGYSDDLPYVTGDATNIVSGRQIQTAVNSLSGINRTISPGEAEMMRQVLINGFKAGLEITGSGNTYSWDDNLRYAATEALIWEIQEGKRWSFGTAPGNYRQEADTVGTNPFYWKEWWDNEVMPRAYPGATNWYYKILEMCQATTSSLNITSNYSGYTANASKDSTYADTLNATYQGNGQYELAFHVSNSALWGDQYGQFNAAGVEWIPDEGSRPATLHWAGNTGYLTSSSERPDEPISGYLKFTQNASNTAFNDIGYMSGSTSNSWRGFIFGGNSVSTELYLRVGSTGGPDLINVKFEDADTGEPVRVDWNFQVNDTDITEFTENSTGKSFLPQYYLDHHSQANYKINLISVPLQYQLPKELTTLFYYNSGTGVLKHGTGAGTTGWGSWDYDAAQAYFNGNTITIRLKAKPTVPVTVKFVDGDTGAPVPVSFRAMQQGLIFYEEQFSVQNKSAYTWTPTARKSQRIMITEAPEGYDISKPTYNFSYQYGFPMQTTEYSNMTVAESGLITIKLYKLSAANSITIEVRNGDTGQLMEKGGFAWSLTSPNGFELLTDENRRLFHPSATGKHTITLALMDENGDLTNTADTIFQYNGRTVSLAAENKNPYASAHDRVVTLYIYPNGTTAYNVNIQFIDAKTGEPLEVGWHVRPEDQSYNEYEVAPGYSSGSSFLPEYFQYTGEGMVYWMQLEDVPDGYDWPADYEMPFFYEAGRIVYDFFSESEYEEMNAVIHGNSITVSIDPSADPLPEPEPDPDADMGLTFIQPNSDYHFGEQVISSYYLKNKNARAYNPTTTVLNAKLTFEKTDGGQTTVLAEQAVSDVVCPGDATQLIYFKWQLPALLMTGTETFQLRTAVYDSSGKQVTQSVDAVNVSARVSMITAPNSFDLDGGKGFHPVSPLTQNQAYYNSAAWQQYVWADGQYTVKTYQAKLWTDEITVYPDETNPSASLSNQRAAGQTVTSRSGYALKLRLRPKLEQFDGATPITNDSQITPVQYAEAYFPEYQYAKGASKFSSLELTDGMFCFPVYAESTYEPGENGDGRKHFVPMWYPDGAYTVQCQTSGCWTPAGMISYTDEANPIMIRGSLYDDWYSSGKGK